MFRFELNSAHTDTVLYEDVNHIILNRITVPNNDDIVKQLCSDNIKHKKVYIIKPLERFSLDKEFDKRAFFIGNEIATDKSCLLLHLKCNIDCFFPDLNDVVHSDKKYTISYMAHRFQPERFEFLKLIHKNLKNDFLVSFANISEQNHHETTYEVRDGIELPFHQHTELQIQKYYVKFNKETAKKMNQGSVQDYYEDAVRIQSQSLINFYFETDFSHYGISEKSVLPLISKVIPVPITKSKKLIDALKSVGFNFFFDELGLPEVFDFNNSECIQQYDNFFKNVKFEDIEKIYLNNLDKIEKNYILMNKIANEYTF